MSTIMLAHQDVSIPAGFAGLNAYRKGAKSDDYPSHGWFSYLAVDPYVDFSMEVMNRSSVKKDLEILPELYAKAGISEYWLVDARSDEPLFDILRLAGKRYFKSRKQSGGWLKSAVFGRSFRLVTKSDRLGNPQFTLEVRDK